MKYLKLSVLIFFITITSIVVAQSTPQQMVDRMGRGINLGNVLSAPIEGNWAPAVQETYFQDVASVGFTTVRIPIRFDNQTTALNSVTYEDTSGNYIGSPADYSVNTSYLDRIEEVTDWALNEGLIAIIDIHGDHWYWESYDSGSSEYKTGNERLAAEDRFRAIWIAISNRFQNTSEDLLFEIMNEAYFSMSASEVDIVNTDILSIIRQTNPTRNVIVNGGGLNSWEAPFQMSSTFINSDNYLISTFHYYKSFSFTSSSKEQFNDFDWGTISDKNSIDNHFDAVLNWSQTNNIPVLLGEFGADNEGGYNYFSETYGAFGGPDNASRVAYHEYLAEAAVSRGFAFTAWDAGEKSNKTIYKVSDRSWVIDVRDALLGIDCLISGIIVNADIECGFDNAWSLFTQDPSIATYANADPIDSKENTTSIDVNVTNSNGSFNSVVLRNEIITDASLSDKILNFDTYAKGSNSGQQFKIRLKAVVNGVNQLIASPTFNLSNTDYELFEFQYLVPQNITSLQLQVLCGKQTGNYFFDDFLVEEQTLSIQDNQTNNIIFYPNPVKELLNITSLKPVKEIQLFDLKGASTIINKDDSTINLSQYHNGMYILKITYLDQTKSYNKLLINH